jgi:hypothetical protein
MNQLMSELENLLSQDIPTDYRNKVLVLLEEVKALERDRSRLQNRMDQVFEKVFEALKAESKMVWRTCLNNILSLSDHQQAELTEFF